MVTDYMLSPLIQLIGCLLLSTAICAFLYVTFVERFTTWVGGFFWIRPSVWLLTILIFPFLIAAWSDIVDVTSFGNDTLAKHFAWLMAFALAFPIIVSVNLWSIHVERLQNKASFEHEDELSDLEAELKATKLQNLAHVRFLLAITRAVDSYQNQLRETLEKVRLNPNSLKDVAAIDPLGIAGKKLVHAVRLALDAVIPPSEELGKDHPPTRTTAALFLEDDSGNLELVYSSDGDFTGLANEFVKAEPHRFVIKDGKSSASYASRKNCVVIDANTIKSHKNKAKAFEFIGYEVNNEAMIRKQVLLIKSMLTIPLMIDPANNRRAVICVSANVEDAVAIEEFAWFTNEIRNHLEPRFRLLFAQGKLLEYFGSIPGQLRSQYERTISAIRAAEEKKRGELEGRIASYIEKNNELDIEVKGLLKAGKLAKEETLEAKEAQESLNQEMLKLKRELTATKGKLTKLINKSELSSDE